MKYKSLLPIPFFISLVFSSLLFTNNNAEAISSNETMIHEQEKIIEEASQKEAQLLEKKQQYSNKKREILLKIDSFQTKIKEKTTGIDSFKKLSSLSPNPTVHLENKQQKNMVVTDSITSSLSGNNKRYPVQKSESELELLQKQQADSIKEQTAINSGQIEVDDQLNQLAKLMTDAKNRKEALQATLVQEKTSKSAIVEAAKAHLGKPYVYGAAGPDAFDCSGLVQIAFAATGRSIGRTTVAQESAGPTIAVAEAQAGDLVFWGSTGGTYHVGISLGDGSYIHAPVPGDVVQIATVASYSPDFAVRI